MIQDEMEFANDYLKLGTVSPKWQVLGEYLQDPLQYDSVDHLEISDKVQHLEIYADPMLSKVILNLMDNSVKHGGKAVTVRIDCEEGMDGLLLTYEDNGQGVPFEEKEKIFEKGFGKGTGLGLFLSKEILAITGIMMKETGRPGQGARFELQIPRGNYRLATGS